MVHPGKRRSHKKEISYILFIIFTLALGLLSIFGRGGYLELRKARLELETHRMRVTAIEQANDKRRQNINQLKSDKAAIEKYAREKGYGREGEIIQQVPSDVPAPGQQPPANPQTP
jgi:cell division protein FtsB